VGRLVAVRRLAAVPLLEAVRRLAEVEPVLTQARQDSYSPRIFPISALAVRLSC
jgi:hypothetical protein